jgi:hypothetical protein
MFEMLVAEEQHPDLTKKFWKGPEPYRGQCGKDFAKMGYFVENYVMYVCNVQLLS